MLKSLIVKYDYLIKINIYFDDKIKYCSISSMSSLFGLIHLVFLTINNNGEEDCELIINDKSIDYYNQRKKKQYHGLKITHIPINSFSAFNTFLSILAFCKQHNITLTLSKDFLSRLQVAVSR